MDKNIYSFDKNESFIDKKTGIEIFNLKGFKTQSSDSSVIHLKGKYFAIKYGVHYGHLLIDYLGPYLYLKKIYPDLQLIFFKYESSDIYFTCTKPSEDLVNFFNAKVIDLNKENYSFDEFIFFYREDLEITGIPNLLKIDKNAKFILPIIPSRLFLNNFYYVDEHSETFITYATEMLKNVYEYFAQYLINDNYYDKIYITRQINNKKTNLFSDQEWFKKSKERYVSDSKEIIQKIKQKKYKIINLDGLGFFEQINIFYNANIIVSQNGTGMINCLWAKESSQIFKIIKNSAYDYNWNSLINSVNKHHIIDVDTIALNQKDSISKILELIP